MSAKKITILLLLLLLLIPDAGWSQCAMCRAALESHGDAKKAEAVNDGIVYLMVIPYVLMAIIGYWVYRTNRR